MGLFTGLKVIEIASVLAGPAVGQGFAELGATVWKIESPEGDVTRQWKLSTETANTEVSSYFSAVNWGKRSVVLDLKQAEHQNKILAHLADTDVLLTNFRSASQAERLGLGFSTLRKTYPKLIIGNINGYGLNNDRAGFDAVVQAESGFMYLNAEVGALPLKMPVALMDIIAAHQLKAGLFAALYARTQSGEGTFINSSLIGAGITALANQAAAYLWHGSNPKPTGSQHPSIAPYGTVYRTLDDGLLLLAVGTDEQFRKLRTILKLADDPRFDTNPSRVKYRKDLEQLLSNAISQHTIDSLFDALKDANIPAGKVQTVAEALKIPEAANFILHALNGQRGLRTLAFETIQQPYWHENVLTAPPKLGQHTHLF